MFWINLIGTTIVSMLTSYIFMCNISNTKITKNLNKKKIIMYIFLNIIFFLNLMFMKNLNKVLLNIFILILLSSYCIFNLDYKKSLYSSLVFLFVNCIFEIVLALISSLLFNVNMNSYVKYPILQLVFTIIDSIFMLLVSKIKPINKVYNSLYDKMHVKLKDLLFFIFLMIYMIVLCFNNFNAWGNNIDYFTNFGTFIFVIISTIFLVYNKLQRDKIEEQLNQMVEYVSKYEKIINEQGKRNHEFNNQLMVLNGYINDKEKLEEYLSLIINEQKGGQNYRIKQLGYLPDGGLKGLIYYKLSKMEEKNIKSYLYVSDNLKHVFDDFSVEFYQDITKIFGVLVDNAIDAASEADPKEVELDIKYEDGCLIIVISNTFKKGIDVSKIGKKGYSSKGVGHGFGLSIVNDISKKNDKIEIFSDVDDDMYKQTLMVYTK